MLLRSPDGAPSTPTPPPGDDRPLRARVAARIVAWVRAWDDWREVSALRLVLVGILAVVSAYYLTIWAQANGMPLVLAPSLFVALDMVGYTAVKVVRRSPHRSVKLGAGAVAALVVLASAAGNAGAHLIELKKFTVNAYSIIGTVSVFPVCLFLGLLVASGMPPRPQTAEQLQAAELAETRAREERLRLEAEGKAERRRIEASGRPTPATTEPSTDTVPAPAAPVARRPAPTAAPAAKQPRTAHDQPTTAPAPPMRDVEAAALAFMTAHPEFGRRLLHRHLKGESSKHHPVSELGGVCSCGAADCPVLPGWKIYPGLTDHASKPIHAAAQAAVADTAAAAV